MNFVVMKALPFKSMGTGWINVNFKTIKLYVKQVHIFTGDQAKQQSADFVQVASIKQQAIIQERLVRIALSLSHRAVLSQITTRCQPQQANVTCVIFLQHPIWQVLKIPTTADRTVNAKPVTNHGEQLRQRVITADNVAAVQSKHFKETLLANRVKPTRCQIPRRHSASVTRVL